MKDLLYELKFEFDKSYLSYMKIICVSVGVLIFVGATVAGCVMSIVSGVSEGNANAGLVILLGIGGLIAGLIAGVIAGVIAGFIYGGILGFVLTPIGYPIYRLVCCIKDGDIVIKRKPKREKKPKNSLKTDSAAQIDKLDNTEEEKPRNKRKQENG